MEYFVPRKEKKIEDYDPEIVAWEREELEGLHTPLMYKFPGPGDNIKQKQFFTVRDYEKALFYNKGELIGVLTGGMYELKDEGKVKGTEIVWIDTSLLNIPWKIPKDNGIPTKEGYMIGLEGDLKLRISDVKIFYNDIVAGKKIWAVQDLRDWIMSTLLTSLRDIFKDYKMRNIFLEQRDRVINLVISKITEEFAHFGLELITFNILNINTPKDIEEILYSNRPLGQRIVRRFTDRWNEFSNRMKDFSKRVDDWFTDRQAEMLDKKNDTE
jgi:membrane protease subunit (stomatin/prohibitin family)